MKWMRVYPVFSHPSYTEKTGFFTSTIAPESVAVALHAHWSRREDAGGHAFVEPLQELDLTQKYVLDRGGIMMKGRTEYSFLLDGLQLHIPAVQLEMYYDKLVTKTSELVRGFGRIYGLGGRFWQLAFLPTHRALLLAEMLKVLEEARSVADAENADFNKRMVGLPHTQIAPRPVRKTPGRT